jgi:hypothetical protein
MPSKRYRPEEIVAAHRHLDVPASRRQDNADAIRRIDVRA